MELKISQPIFGILVALTKNEGTKICNEPGKYISFSTCLHSQSEIQWNLVIVNFVLSPFFLLVRGFYYCKTQWFLFSKTIIIHTVYYIWLYFCYITQASLWLLKLGRDISIMVGISENVLVYISFYILLTEPDFI